MFRPDDGGCKASSPWDKWKYDPDQPLVAVLVMEKLGEPYYRDRADDDPPHERYVGSTRLFLCSHIVLGKTSATLCMTWARLGSSTLICASTMSFVWSTQAFFVPAIAAIIDGVSSILTGRGVACSPLKPKKTVNFLNRGLKRSGRHIFAMGFRRVILALELFA